jgi:hypothetical protein
VHDTVVIGEMALASAPMMTEEDMLELERVSPALHVKVRTWVCVWTGIILTRRTVGVEPA